MLGSWISLASEWRAPWKVEDDSIEFSRHAVMCAENASVDLNECERMVRRDYFIAFELQLSHRPTFTSKTTSFATTDQSVKLCRPQHCQLMSLLHSRSSDDQLHVPASSDDLIYRSTTALHSASDSASGPCCNCRFLCSAASSWPWRYLALCRLPPASTTNEIQSVARTLAGLVSESLYLWVGVECPCWKALRTLCLLVLSDWRELQPNRVLEGGRIPSSRVYLGRK